jgi:hypothetical protein
MSVAPWEDPSQPRPKSKVTFADLPKSGTRQFPSREISPNGKNYHPLRNAIKKSSVGFFLPTYNRNNSHPR